MKMTVIGSGSVHEKIRKTPVSITALFHEKGLESQLPPAYPAVLLQTFDELSLFAWKNPLPVTLPLYKSRLLYNVKLFTEATGEQQIKAKALKVWGSTFRPAGIKRIIILTFLQFSLVILHGLIILFLFYFWYVGSLAIGFCGGGILIVWSAVRWVLFFSKGTFPQMPYFNIVILD